MLTPNQKTNREGTLGSSDAPVVAGLSPYKSPLTLFYELNGTLPRYSDEETAYQRIGSKLEPVIAEIAAEELGVKIRRAAPRRSTTHPFMSANIDYEIVANPKGPGVFEIKNRAGQKPWDQLPEDIELQARHQLAVTNREWGIVAALFQFGTIRHYAIERDKEIEAYIIEIEGRFMLRVERNEPPDTVWDQQGLDLLKKLYPRDYGKTITLDSPEAVRMIEQYLKVKHDIKEFEDMEAAAKGWIQNAMQDATYAEILGYTCSWKSTKPSKRFDEDAFRAAHPDLYQQFIRERPGYRRFLVKNAKEIA